MNKTQEKKMRKIRNSELKALSFTVNGENYNLFIGRDVRSSHTLAHTLRETLGLTGTKIACDHGGCCSCTVLADGEPILSCMTLTVECDGKNIVTIEGLKDSKTGELNPLQKSFVSHSAFQCGFCTPGLLMSAQALLDKSLTPPMRRSPMPCQATSAAASPIMRSLAP